MTFLLALIAGTAIVAVVFITADMAAHRNVFGPMISEDELDAYLGKYLNEAVLNPYSSDGSLFCDIPLYIARQPSILSEWYIERRNGAGGPIPRKSKWTKLINERRAQLLAEGRKTLKDY